MRWIVGIDQRDRSRGAIEMAAWLRAHSHAPDEQQLYGLHVLEGRLDDPDVRARLVTDAHRAIDRSIAAPTPLAELHVGDGTAVEESLQRYADVIGAEAMLIGRIGTREIGGITRLGKVARRMLRSSEYPVVVVPPDLQRTAIGAGAIVLATDLGPASASAARFARRLATACERELLVLHVDGAITPAYPELTISPGPELADVIAWARHHELEPTRVRLARGDVVEHVLAVASEEHAPLIVVGSRRLTLGERIFGSSLGTDLARVADRAVAVVPPA
ncbi:MAG TPA: universal stress protein [Nannocystaceae bacterium]|nr:universal stress protein [Nannocystaceae bacterium]